MCGIGTRNDFWGNLVYGLTALSNCLRNRFHPTAIDTTTVEQCFNQFSQIPKTTAWRSRSCHPWATARQIWYGGEQDLPTTGHQPYQTEEVSADLTHRQMDIRHQSQYPSVKVKKTTITTAHHYESSPLGMETCISCFFLQFPPHRKCTELTKNAAQNR